MSRLGRLALGVAGVALFTIMAMVVAQPEDEAAPRCVAADARLMADIAEGLDTGVTAGDGQMVRSDDFELVWFVAADVDGGQGVWATDRVDVDGAYTGAGLLYSVNEDAQRISDWGTHTPAMDDDGAQDALACLD